MKFRALEIFGRHRPRRTIVVYIYTRTKHEVHIVVGIYFYLESAKNIKIRRNRDPGAIIDAVDGQVILQTSVQALNTLRGYMYK